MILEVPMMELDSMLKKICAHFLLMHMKGHNLTETMTLHIVMS